MPILPVLNLRKPDLPLALLDPVFAKFTDDCRTAKPTAAAYECARHLKIEMNRFYGDEVHPVHALCEILTIGGFEINPGPIGESNTRTNGHFFRLLILLEATDEVVWTGADPTLQALLYYEIFTQHYKLWTDVLSSVYPCFIITLAGKVHNLIPDDFIL